MKKLVILVICLFLSIATMWANASSDNKKPFQHKIIAKIDIQNSLIQVVDTIIFPSDYIKGNPIAYFYLNSNLKISSENSAFELKKVEEKKSEHGEISITKYAITFPKKAKGESFLVLSYTGKIFDEIKTGAVQYARGFSETSGIISSNGVYLAGATNWISRFENNELHTFTLQVEIDKDWTAVSQGTRITNLLAGDKRIVKYSSTDPMDEVYLIANKWTEYSLQSGNVLVQAFLRTPDEKLANKYLGATSKYLKLYENLIGPYPFTKFALIENFWETGFGMPSFTLLGEKVIRFPWILDSSYPHELLHNYWGNSVFVNYTEGNWCEGITAYMADHLIKEQTGEGEEYRRTTLQKYTDYVNESNDFPVSKFISRNNSAEEAIGYGKVLMINNMLRYELGDEIFVKAYAKFYNDFKFKQATFDDLKSCFNAVSGKDLTPFFNQWVKRTGAPTLELSDVKIENLGGKFNITFTLSQTQKENVFDINVPVAIYLVGNEQTVFEKINLKERKKQFTFSYSSRPQRIDIDPQFNIMRRLAKSEVPSTLSQVFGSKKGFIILPSSSKNLESYSGMARMWSETQAAQGNKLTILNDNAIENLPDSGAVWVLGFENKFASKFTINDDYKKLFSPAIIAKIDSLQTTGALIYAMPNPANGNYPAGFVGANSAASITALSQKLLHYGKYGYLGFVGDAATNVLKGFFPALFSTLNYIDRTGNQAPIQAKLVQRKALTEYNKK